MNKTIDSNKRIRTTNKTKKVLEHLQKQGSITSWEAIQNYGATRLSAIIYNLRKHYIIEGINSVFIDMYGNQNTFTKYIYIKKRNIK